MIPDGAQQGTDEDQEATASHCEKQSEHKRKRE
jgi:hypothetical protein